MRKMLVSDSSAYWWVGWLAYSIRKWMQRTPNAIRYISAIYGQPRCVVCLRVCDSQIMLPFLLFICLMIQLYNCCFKFYRKYFYVWHGKSQPSILCVFVWVCRGMWNMSLGTFAAINCALFGVLSFTFLVVVVVIVVRWCKAMAADALICTTTTTTTTTTQLPARE